jgi:hypothetical protein
MTIGIIITLILTVILILIFRKGVKYTFTGNAMIKYAMIAYIVKIGLAFAIIFAIVPYIIVIADHIDANITETINYWLILKNWGIMALMFVIALAIEAVFAFGILIPIAKKIEFDN